MATPTEILKKIKEFKDARQALVSHETLSRRGLLSKSDHLKLKSSATNCQVQLFQMVGENPVAQALLQYIVDCC